MKLLKSWGITEPNQASQKPIKNIVLIFENHDQYMDIN